MKPAQNMYTPTPATYDLHGMPRRIRRNRMLTIVIFVLAFGVFLTLVNIYELRMVQADHYNYHDGVAEAGYGGMETRQPVVWVNAKRARSGYLKHVFNVFDRIGYTVGNENSNWDVLWSHEYPFSTLKTKIGKLKPHQKINHFPGSGYITNKVFLATSNISHVPKAFKIPIQKEQFLSYAKKFPDKQWVQKSSNHRGIKILKLKDLELEKDNTFIQEYIDDPFLIDGRRFDIGIYTTMTSVDPLRVYINQGDWLIRFCPEEYHPFDPKRLLKYVVTDDYKPMWELPSLKEAYVDHDMTRKETLFTYIRKQGYNATKLEESIKDAVRSVYLNKEMNILNAVKNWGNRRHFFEMVRFDFVVDKNLNVYLMEVNMSPNLSSGHFPANRLLYEQVVYGMLGLVGVSSPTRAIIHKSDQDEAEMQVSTRDIKTHLDLCLSDNCKGSCKVECKLCKDCLSADDIEILTSAYLEHLNRRAWRRVLPSPFDSKEKAMKWRPNTDHNFQQLNVRNRWMLRWFHGKCLQDPTWCS